VSSWRRSSPGFPGRPTKRSSRDRAGERRGRRCHGQHFSHLLGEALAGERLQYDRVVRLAGRSGIRVLLLSLAEAEGCHEEHLHVGTLKAELLRQLATVRSGHHDVGQQQVNHPGVARGDAHGLLGIAGAQCLIALQHLPDDGEHLRVIVHDQDRLHVPSPGDRPA
jgi:hypothetical protein